MSDNDDAGGRAPRLRVIRGDATPEEIAALVVALAARTRPAPRPAARRPRSNWRRPALRTPLPHGAGAWRASALPH